MRSLIRSIPGAVTAYQAFLRLNRRRYWTRNARGDDLGAFCEPNLPARLFWEFVRPRLGYSVLEIGCGNGRDLIAAARDFPRSSFTGVDIQAEAIAVARTKSQGLPNITFRTGEVSPAGFDTVLACATLIYFSPRQLRRLLSATTGNLFFCEITAVDGPVKTHIYAHAYKEIVRATIPEARHEVTYFDYAPWEGAGYKGAMHSLTRR